MEAPPLERKLVAILAADVEGYSRMMEVDEEGTLLTLSAHRTITDELIAQHSGRRPWIIARDVVAEGRGVLGLAAGRAGSVLPPARGPRALRADSPKRSAGAGVGCVT